jgi:hypothetical protein
MKEFVVSPIREMKRRKCIGSRVKRFNAKVKVTIRYRGFSQE